MKKPEHQGRSIRQELDIAAAADRVWSAWADPQRIAQWFVDRATGFAKKGEVVQWYFDAMKVEVPQPVVEAEPGTSFITGGEYGGRAWLLEVALEHRGGITRMRLINSGFGEGPEADEQVEGIDSGWLLASHTLKHWLEVHEAIGGERIHTLVMHPAGPAFSWERLAPLFTTPVGLSRWLGRTSGPGELAAGSAVTIDIEGGERLVGQVLCRSRREVMLEWPARAAVVSLKAFAAGPMTMLALDVSAWGKSAASDAAVRAWAQPALQRLAAAMA
jgi:uncharacterized protein YndB with AHSA1/START domain